MATSIVRFEPGWLPAVRRFAEQVWRRPRSEAFYRWRYLEAPALQGYLAVSDGEVVATLWAFRRPWRVGRQSVHFLEVFDWYTLPMLRGGGPGVRLLQAAMKEDDPCVLVGGSPDSRSLMPRLGFRCVVEAERFVLPLDGRRLAPALARRTRLPGPLVRPLAGALARTWFRPRRRSFPDGRSLAVGLPGEEALKLLEEADAWPTRPLWSQAHLRWLAGGFAGNGALVPLYFQQGDRLRGFALLRVHPAAQGREAQLVELVGDALDPELHAWMVGEVASLAAGMGAGLLAALSSCPATRAALRAHRFQALEMVPVNVWSKSGLDLPGPLHVGHNTGDDALIPSVERWW